jgi:hypothetical protein
MKPAPAHGPISERSAAGTAGFAASYLVAMGAGAVAIIALFGITLLLLDRAGILPPPQIANHLCVDDKLRFLRTSQLFDPADFAPTVLAAGSSATWRSLDGEAVESAAAHARFFNGGFCGLKLNETAFAARYFLARYPSIREVVTILAPQDMTECQKADARFFDPATVDRYVYGGGLVFPLYLQYFDPFTFVSNVFRIAADRDVRWDGGYDRFAGLPMDTTETPDKLVYGALDPFDPACFEALRALALELRAAGVRLVIATMPVNPAWLQRYDPHQRRMAELANRLEQALDGTSATLWKAHTNLSLQRADFLDAVHIRWTAARAYSRALVRETGLSSTPLPPVQPRLPIRGADEPGRPGAG